MCSLKFNDALGRGDKASAQEIFNQMLQSPEFLCDEYNLLHQFLVPQCNASTIELGLHRCYTGSVQHYQMCHVTNLG